MFFIMFSLYLYGFLLEVQISSHSPKTCRLGQPTTQKLPICVNVNVNIVNPVLAL